jgi:hypothetical protein
MVSAIRKAQFRIDREAPRAAATSKNKKSLAEAKTNSLPAKRTTPLAC